MKKILLVVWLFALGQHVFAQFTITGTVRDKKNLMPLSPATVIIGDAASSVTTAPNGVFRFDNISPGKHTISIRYLGYQNRNIEVDIHSDITLEVDMETLIITKDPVEIIALRAHAKSAMAYSDITKTDLEKNNNGRDIPYLLESVPSLVATSDAGTGIGYTGVRLRGSDGTRINVTIDGIPINDAESQQLYWVDMPDLASSVENIQVQRGAGTSTNGASAFGGSINIQSGRPSEKPFLTTSGAFGSFNTFKTNAKIGTGLIDNKWNFEGTLSKITSDGYIDRAASDLKSIFISGGYYGKKSTIRMQVISGKENTYQSWYGVPEAALDTNRTWNYYTYENQVDDYQQDHYRLFFTHSFSETLQLNTAFHYTYGRGYYEEYKEDQSMNEYLLLPVMTGGDTISETNLVRRKWLDNDFYGTTLSLQYAPSAKFTFTGGGAWNRYDGDHFGEVIWAQFASNGNNRHKYYDNNGLKTDFNVFAKFTVNLFAKFDLFADMQYRYVDYKFEGVDQNGLPLPQSDRLNFFNPKAGVTYTLSPGQYGYISFSTGNKEPSRDDYTETTVNSRPESERLYDIECGYFIRKRKFKAGFNYYMMLYDNQLVLTGEVNDVGNYTRTNIKTSSREGIEIEGGWLPSGKLSLNGNVTFSKNKINKFSEYVDDYDNGGQVLQIHKNTDIAFSPGITAYLNTAWKPVSKLEISLINRYVGKQFLDNTSDASRAIDPFFVNDFRISWTFNPKFMKAIEFSFFVNNLLDEVYESNGYTFSYISGGEKITENYYYPQAGRNFMGMVTMKF